jgi:GT2 family glycosyltransferase
MEERRGRLLGQDGVTTAPASDPADSPAAAASAREVSVIIPHYRDLDRLRTCLDSLERQTLPRALFEIIVIDNMSFSDPAPLVQLVGQRATLLFCAEKGAGPTRNRGLEAATARIVAFIDADCRADPGWLAALLAAFAKAGAAPVLGGAVHVDMKPLATSSAAEAYEYFFAFRNREYVVSKKFSVTANMAARIEVFSRVGGFRNGVPEDKDWCLRAGAAGFPIAYCDEAVVFHPPRRTTSELLIKWRRLDSEAAAFEIQGFAAGLRWAVKGAALAASVPVRALVPLLRRGDYPLSFRMRAAAMAVFLGLWRASDYFRLLPGGLRRAFGRAASA